MPSVRSLESREYYAHPRNAYWHIMGELFGAGPDLAYAQRLERLRELGIALWDVVASCDRPGSLDANISAAEPNDLVALLRDQPTIRDVFFNGAPRRKSSCDASGRASARAAKRCGFTRCPRPARRMRRGAAPKSSRRGPRFVKRFLESAIETYYSQPMRSDATLSQLARR